MRLYVILAILFCLGLIVVFKQNDDLQKAQDQVALYKGYYQLETALKDQCVSLYDRVWIPAAPACESNGPCHFGQMGGIGK